jgi:membrane protein
MSDPGSARRWRFPAWRTDGIARRFPRLWRWVAAPALVSAGRVATDSVGIQAGSLTYGAFLSLPPILVLTTSIASLVLRGNPSAVQSIVSAVEAAVPGLSQVITTQLDLQTAQQLGIGMIGVATIVWAASGFAARMRHALGRVFGTGLTGLVFGRFSAALLGTPLVLLFVVLTGLGGIVEGFGASHHFPVLERAATGVLTAVVTFLFAMITYRLLTPGAGPPVRRHLPGAIVFTAGWLVLHAVGAEYVAVVVAQSSALYGAIGAIFGLFAFIYLSMWWLLFGAEWSRAYLEFEHDGAAPASIDPPWQAPGPRRS